MKLFAKCPNCGGFEWSGRGEDGSFICGKCHTEIMPEEMSLSSAVILNEVCWKKDTATSRYVKRHEELLQEPSRMTPFELSAAITYCQSALNPYSKELVERAGMAEEFEAAASLRAKAKVQEKAAKVFDITMV